MSPGDIAFWIRRAVYQSEYWDKMKENGCTPEEMENFLAIREAWNEGEPPEKTGWYLARLSLGPRNTQRVAILYWDGSGWWDSDFISREFCEAWMPLPAT